MIDELKFKNILNENFKKGDIFFISSILFVEGKSTTVSCIVLDVDEEYKYVVVYCLTNEKDFEQKKIRRYYSNTEYKLTKFWVPNEK